MSDVTSGRHSAHARDVRAIRRDDVRGVPPGLRDVTGVQRPLGQRLFLLRVQDARASGQLQRVALYSAMCLRDAGNMGRFRPVVLYDIWRLPAGDHTVICTGLQSHRCSALSLRAKSVRCRLPRIRQ